MIIIDTIDTSCVFENFFATTIRSSFLYFSKLGDIICVEIKTVNQMHFVSIFHVELLLI